MSNIFGLLQTGVSGLNTSQAGIDVTGHNIANVNTEGYSRQKINITTNPPYDVASGVFGRGATVESVERIYDDMLAGNLRQEESSLSYWENLQTKLEQVEIYFNELEQGSGLGDALKNYFNAWQELANTAPDNSDEAMVKRFDLIAKTTTLTQKMQESYRALEEIRSESDKNIEESVKEANNIINNIASLNKEIARVESSGNNANDLRDKRELLLNDLSKIMNISTVKTQNGTINVYSAGNMLIDGSQANKLYTVANKENNGHLDIYWGASPGNEPTTNITEKITSGSLSAELKSRDDVVLGYEKDLNNLASTIISSTNRLHSTGQGLSRLQQITSTNGVINPEYTFSEDPGKLPYDVKNGTFRIEVYSDNGDVLNTYDIEVDPETDSMNSIIQKISAVDGDSGGGDIQAYIAADNSIKISTESPKTFAFTEDTSNFLVAAGLNGYFKGSDASDIQVHDLVKNNPAFIATGKTGAVGDNQVALEIANIKFEKVFNMPELTIEEFYSAFASKIGSDKHQVDTFVQTKESTVQQLSLRLEEVKGVSIDEEFTNLIKFQKAYEANSRYITAVDQMIDRLINGTGMVGR